MKIKNVRESEYLNKPFNGNFYDADYFERGQETGKGWLQNYRWLPRRTFKEAFTCGYTNNLLLLFSLSTL